MSSAANATARITLAKRNEAIREALAKPDGQRPTLKALAIEHGLSVERVRQIGERIKQIGPDVSRLTSRDGSRILIESKFDGGYDVYLQPARKPRTFLGTITGIRQRWVAFAGGKQIATSQKNLACACEEILSVYQASLAPIEQAVEATVDQAAEVAPRAHDATTTEREETSNPETASLRLQKMAACTSCMDSDAANDPERINLIDFAAASKRKQDRAIARILMKQRVEPGSRRRKMSPHGAKVPHGFTWHVPERATILANDLKLQAWDPGFCHGKPNSSPTDDVQANRIGMAAPPGCDIFRSL